MKLIKTIKEEDMPLKSYCKHCYKLFAVKWSISWPDNYCSEHCKKQYAYEVEHPRNLTEKEWAFWSKFFQEQERFKFKKRGVKQWKTL